MSKVKTYYQSIALSCHVERSELKIGGAKHLFSKKRSFPPVRMTE